ncbi:MAG: TMEM175 family protein [Armatimonas sp.]
MTKGRLEAFSDGVMAILITILVLELRAPHGATMEALLPLWPKFLGYVLSFIYLGIYWNNHHHLLHTVRKVRGSILWGNLHLLFWLSLIPFVTAWMGENHFAALPTAFYGIILLMSGVAYWILQGLILADHEIHSNVRDAIGGDFKGKASIVLYAIAVGLALRWPWVAWSFYALVACMWLIPDRRIETALNPGGH